MRAFMSERTQRPIARFAMHCLIMGPPVESLDASIRAEAKDREAAEREARAILADVKPGEGWPVSTSEWDSEQPVWNLAPWQLRGACYRDAVEALAAFVGDAQ